MYPYVFVAGPNKHDALLIIACANGTRNSTALARIHTKENTGQPLCSVQKLGTYSLEISGKLKSIVTVGTDRQFQPEQARRAVTVRRQGYISRTISFMCPSRASPNTTVCSYRMCQAEHQILISIDDNPFAPVSAVETTACVHRRGASRDEICYSRRRRYQPNNLFNRVEHWHSVFRLYRQARQRQDVRWDVA